MRMYVSLDETTVQKVTEVLHLAGEAGLMERLSIHQFTEGALQAAADHLLYTLRSRLRWLEEEAAQGGDDSKQAAYAGLREQLGLLSDAIWAGA